MGDDGAWAELARDRGDRIATLEAQLATAVGALERIEAAKGKEYDPGIYADDHQQGYAAGHDAGVEECADIADKALASIKGGS